MSVEMDLSAGRHVYWSMTAVCSTVALTAIITGFEGNVSDEGQQQKWAVSAISIVLALSWISVFANMLMKSKFVSTMVEGLLALLTVGFWAAVLPAIMDPNARLAVVARDGGIRNANLYFFSWGAFIMSFYVFMSFLKEKRGDDKAFTLTTWGSLCMTSFITMISGARLFNNDSCDQDPMSGTETCNRLSFAVSVGVISGIIAAVWMLLGMVLTNKFGQVVNVLLSLITLILWTFAIGYLTFGGNNGPATTIGNLYFFTWGSFAISVMIMVYAMREFMEARRSQEAPADSPDVEAGNDNAQENPKEDTQGDKQAVDELHGNEADA